MQKKPEECPAVEKLEAWLSHKNRTQADLARKLGVTSPSVYAWRTRASRPVPLLREMIKRLTNIPESAWEFPSERAHRTEALARVKKQRVTK